MAKDPAVNVKVPKRSGFNKSHHNVLTHNVGTLVPLMCDEVIPNTKVNLRIALAAALPPLASDAYLKCSYKVEAFFVPMRLLCGSFESFFTNTTERFLGSSIIYNRQGVIPTISITANTISLLNGFLKPGSLGDYLGFRLASDEGSIARGINFTPLPFLAYHMIWDNFYRSPMVTQSCFCRPSVGSSPGSNYFFATLPYRFVVAEQTSSAVIAFTDEDGYSLADGKSIFDLRQRCFGFDYFTNAQPNAQSGTAQSVTTADNSFTIGALRAANSIQQWEELNSLAGTRFVDHLRARFGAKLSDGVAQRPIFLGSASYEVYNRGVQVNATNFEGATLPSYNPFAKSAGAKVGSAFASGSDFLIDGFTANEPGYIMVLGSLVPRATYALGIRRYLLHYNTGTPGSIADMANHMLQNTGNQPILSIEVGASNVPGTIFGYSDRYCEFMNMEDECHGNFRSGKSLSSFVSQRALLDATLSTSFLEIPTSYLNNVTVTSNAVSTYGCMVDVDFDYKVAMPLYPYSLPSLQNPAFEHGKDVTIHRGGFRF